MKKIIYTTFILIILFITISIVKAESFYEEAYVTTYVKKIKDGKTYYLQMRPLRERGTNKLVYCLEPFEFFDEEAVYNRIDDFTNYKLSLEQMNRIEKLAYYGFGYKPKWRNTYTWYVVTQVMIWKTVDPEADIFFTSYLNGPRDETEYLPLMRELESDVGIEGTVFTPRSEYTLYKGDNLSLSLGTNYFEVLDSDYEYEQNKNNLNISNINNSGYIKVRERANTNSVDKSIIYASDGNQDILLPGIMYYKTYNIRIKVLEGDIKLVIKKDESAYSSEANFNNTCYKIKNSNGNEIERVCASDELTYKTNIIPYGTYYIEQISNGTGYIKDNNKYKVIIDEGNPHGVIELNNHLIKNNIEINKKYCKNNICSYESGATFELYDYNNNFVNSYITDNKGNINIELGYGHYTIFQTIGKEGYQLADTIEDFINDEDSIHYYELYDNYVDEEIEKKIDEDIVIEEQPKEEPIIEESIEEEPIIITEPEEVKETIETKEEVKNDEENNTNQEVKEEIIEEMPPNTGVYRITKKIIQKIIKGVKRIIECTIFLSSMCQKLLF